MASTSVVFDILARDRASDKFDKVAKAASSTDSKLSKFGSIAKTAFKGLVVGAGAGGVALFNMGQKAGDLNETISKTNQIFGAKSGGQLANWAKSAAQNFGLSQRAALDAASTFGTYGKAAGKTGDDLQIFAMEQTAMAADLASFNNTTPEEAIEALGSAFRGEAEPLRRYGVLLDDASMRQEAMRQGLIKTTKEALTPQQKILAAQGLIMKQTSDAQGDFSRTSGGLANQQRILRAEFENVQTSIGQKVLPVMLTLATWANTTLIPTLGKIGDWINTNVIPALQKMGDWVQSHVLPIFQRLGSEGPGIFTKIRSVIDAVVPVVMKVARTVGENLRPVFDQLVATFRSDVLPTLQKIITRFKEWWPTISKVIVKLAEIASVILGKVLPPVIRFAGFLLRTLVPAILKTIEIAAKIIGKMFQVGAAFVDAVKDVARFVAGVREKMGNAIDFVKEVPGRIIGALSGLATALYNAAVRAMGQFVAGIRDKIGDAIAAVKDGLAKIAGMLPGSPIKDGPLKSWNNGGAGKRLMGQLAQGIKDGAPGAKTAFDKAMGLMSGEAQIALLASGSAASVKAPPAPGAMTGNSREEQRNLRLAKTIRAELQEWRKQEDRNTTFSVKLDGRDLEVSLNRHRRLTGKPPI